MLGRRAFSRIIQFWRDEDGVSSIEFVILYPLFYWILFMGVELGVMQARQAMLEMALDRTVRHVRLNTIAPSSYQDLRNVMCAEATFLNNCSNSLKLEMVRREPRVGVTLNAPQYHDKPSAVNPAGPFSPGGRNELMFLRVCVLQPPLLPTIGLNPYLPTTETGEYRLVAITSYVTEPA